MKGMRIALSVDGGLASFPGLRQPVTVESDRLPPERVAHLRTLIAAARFFSAQTERAAAGSADARAYTVEIEDGTQCRALTINEPIADANLRTLVAEIRACAREQAGQG